MQRKLSEDQPNVFLYLLPKIGVWNAKVQGLWENIPIPANVADQPSRAKTAAPA